MINQEILRNEIKSITDWPAEVDPIDCIFWQPTSSNNCHLYASPRQEFFQALEEYQQDPKHMLDILQNADLAHKRLMQFLEQQMRRTSLWHQRTYADSRALNCVILSDHLTTDSLIKCIRAQQQMLNLGLVRRHQSRVFEIVENTYQRLEQHLDQHAQDWTSGAIRALLACHGHRRMLDGESILDVWQKFVDFDTNNQNTSRFNGQYTLLWSPFSGNNFAYSNFPATPGYTQDQEMRMTYWIWSVLEKIYWADRNSAEDLAALDTVLPEYIDQLLEQHNLKRGLFFAMEPTKNRQLTGGFFCAA